MTRFHSIALALLCFTFTSIASGAPQLRVLTDLDSADAQGPHAGIASHVIGFQEGRVVPEYMAFQNGCRLVFTHGTVASLAREERFLILGKGVQNDLKPTCLKWGVTAGGDDICAVHGTPVSVVTLDWSLFREKSGERVKLICLAARTDSQAIAERLIWKSLGTLIVAD